jgi:uncharacterized peroxidase-related enzyme
MPRVTPTSLDEHPELAPLWEQITGVLGRVPNSFRVASLSPPLAAWLAPLTSTLHRDGSGVVLESHIRNLVVLKTSLLNECKYCVGHNTSFANVAGTSQEQITALAGDYESARCFDEREKAAIAWAEAVTLNTAKYDARGFERLRTHFTDREIVELTALAAFFNFGNRFNDALHIDLEAPDEVDQIQSKPKVREDEIRAYASAVSRLNLVSDPSSTTRT